MFSTMTCKVNIDSIRQHARQFLLIVLLALLGSSAAYAAPLSGTYSIDPSGGGDYTTITAAVADLETNGISAPVTFNVLRNGGIPYDEQVTIHDFVRTGGAADVVNFSGNAVTKTLWQATAATAANNWVLKLDGAKYITISSFEFRATAADTSVGHLIVMANGVDNMRFEFDDFIGRVGASSSAASLWYAVGERVDNSISVFCTFQNGYRGIDFDGNDGGGVRSTDNRIYSAEFTGQTENAVRMRYQNDFDILLSSIRNDASAAATYIAIEVDGDGAHIQRSSIYLAKGDGIKLRVTPNQVQRDIDNVAISTSGVGAVGIRLQTGYVDIDYTTVVIREGGDAGSSAIRVNNGTLLGINLDSNILINNGAGVAIFSSSASRLNIASSDVNVLHAAGANLVHAKGIDHSTLASYQAASGRDANSIDVSVEFVDAVGPDAADIDLHLAGSSLGNIDLLGTSGLHPDDIDLVTRSTYTYKGADEPTTAIMAKLTLSVVDDGAVTSLPVAINCPSGSCVESFPVADMVVLTASPDANFLSWDGCDAAVANVCTMTMDSNKTLTANFKPDESICFPLKAGAGQIAVICL